MKPIYLTLRGLNSFMEEQQVDFSRLTEMGLFGVFGATGSGKSTLLDAMTLALYGKTARGGEFVNKNSDVCKVSFTFSLSAGQTRVYRVEREYRKNKSGDIRTAYAKLSEQVGTETVVLEDKASTVTKKCEEIIGLGAEDFLRTVVLPQGKFSEFLKLTSGPRREMLERLFNLETYGTQLSGRVSRRMALEKGKWQLVSGQLMGYEEVSEERIRTLEEQASNFEKELKKAEIQHRESTTHYEQIKTQYDLCQRKVAIEKELETHYLGQENYKDIKRQLERDSLAREILPVIQQYDASVKDFEHITQQIEEVNVALEQVENRGKVTLEQLEKVNQENGQILPELKRQETLLREGVLDYRTLATEKASLEVEALTVQEKQTQFERWTQTIENKAVEIREKERLISELEKALERQSVGEEQLTQIRALKQFVAQRQVIFESQSEITQKYHETKTLYENNEIALIQNEAKLKDHFQKRYVYTLEQVERIQRKINDFESDIQAREITLEEKKINFNKMQLSVYRTALQACLEAGEPCPVCGSRHHENENLKIDTSGLGEDVLRAREKEIVELAQRQNEKQLQIGILADAKKRLLAELKEISNQVSHKYAKESARLLEKWSSDIDISTESESDLDRVWQRLRDAGQVANEFDKKLAGQCSTLENLKMRLEELSTSQLKETEKLEQADANIKCLVDAYSQLIGHSFNIDRLAREVSDLEASKEKEKWQQQQLSEYRQVLKNELAQMESLKKLQNAVQIEWVGLASTFETRKTGLDQRVANLESKLGEPSQLEERLNKTVEEVSAREQIQKDLMKAFAAYEMEKSTLMGKAISLKENLMKSEMAKKEQSEKMAQVLGDSVFKEAGQVNQAILETSIRKEFSEWQLNYDKKASELEGRKQMIEQQLTGATIPIEVLEEATLRKEASQEKYQQLRDASVTVEIQLKEMKTKQLEMGALLNEKIQLEQILGELSDLAKLFEARKFVAFMASRQLKYVCKKSSIQLKEITNGVYDLEADEEGNFFVRDFKNGGQMREIASLSGGETFLVSLSLALALSAQIQLKGTAPLELFFLDEGFGTLDDQTLDVVMTALESLPHERLSIGLISHVESIKNRVPIKINLEPARAGFGGSKLKIELT